VHVPAGEHTVEFHFAPNLTGLYVTLAAMGLGALLCVVIFLPRKPEPRRETPKPALAQQR